MFRNSEVHGQHCAKGVETENEAITFIRRVKFALRYNSTPALPLASMYAAAQDQRRPDPADVALGDLQREILIDRGPSTVPRNGIPYLSKEGFPYRVFDKAHPELVKLAKKMKIEAAFKTILEATSAIRPRKTATMFKLCFTEAERRQICARSI